MRNRKINGLICIALSAVLFAGCGNTSSESTALSAAEPTAAPTEAAEETPAPTQEPETLSAEAVSASSEENGLKDGEMYSYLTGLPIDEETGTKRPFAIMINNLEPAVPQSNISSADILYEAEVEGSITRLMAVFQDPTPYEKIGPVRSARHYYIYLADDNEAIFTHFGWSPQAETIINEQGLEHINGAQYDGGGTFFRTTDRQAPHNAYVNGSGLPDLADQEGISREYPDGYAQNLLFHTEDTELADGETANTLNIGFTYDTPVFEYHADDGLYYRSEYGAPHVDAETGEQLSFKNVLVQQVSQVVLEDNVHLDLTLFPVQGGTGYYATDGKIIPITWTKLSQSDRTRYYDMNGNQIELNPGKTMVEVINQNYSITWNE